MSNNNKLSKDEKKDLKKQKKAEKKHKKEEKIREWQEKLKKQSVIVNGKSIPMIFKKGRWTLNLVNLGIKSIQDIENLGNLVQLNFLNLNSNEIRVIEGLENLINLKELNLAHNYITEIEGLENLVNIEILLLTGNPINQLKGIGTLKKLRLFSLWDTPISNWAFKAFGKEYGIGFISKKNVQKAVDYCNTGVIGGRKKTLLEKMETGANVVEGLQNLTENLENITEKGANIINVSQTIIDTSRDVANIAGYEEIGDLLETIGRIPDIAEIVLKITEGKVTFDDINKLSENTIKFISEVSGERETAEAYETFRNGILDFQEGLHNKNNIQVMNGIEKVRHVTKNLEKKD